MKKLKNNLDVIIFSFISIIIFISQRVFHEITIVHRLSSYVFIINTTVFAIYFIIKKKENKAYFGAYLCTLVAETFLTMIINRTYVHQSIGTTFFIFAQLCFMVALNSYHKGNNKIYNISRIGVSVLSLLIGIVLLKENYNYLIAISSIYFVNLFFNVIESIRDIKIYPMFFFGFLAFMLCDLIVGGVIGTEMGVVDFSNNKVIDYILNINDFCWVFYMISQYLLVLSLRVNKKKK